MWEISYDVALATWFIRRDRVEYIVTDSYLRERFGGSKQAFLKAVDNGRVDLVPLGVEASDTRVESAFGIAEALNANTPAK